MHLQALRRRFREFGTNPNTYPNPPCSKPWAIAQAFWSKSADFGSFEIHPKSSPTFSKLVGNPFASTSDAFQAFWIDSRNLPKSAMFKTIGYSPGFLVKIGQFRTLRNSSEIFTNILESSWKCICKHIGGDRRSLERTPKLTQIRHVQKPWAIAQAFWSKSADFEPFQIHPISSPTFSKVVGNAFASTSDAFQGFWFDSRNLPKSAIFKTMGYSPGFLVKIGRFRTLRNSSDFFTNILESIWKCIWKHVGGDSGRLERILTLTQIRHVQIHGL